MTALAVALAVLGACGYALGAHLQHAAVHDTIGDRGLRVCHQLELLRNIRWLAGLVAVAGGAVLHVCALGLAPLSVVQPVGVIALPITVLLNLRQQGVHARDLKLTVVLAVVAATGGVASFVIFAAGSATPTAVSPSDQLTATQLIGGGVLCLGVLATLARSKARCMLFAAGCAVAYGYVSLMMRGLVQQLGTTGLQHLNLLPLLGIAAAMVVGGWLLQHGYASGPPDLVVACLTVIDPLVAVGLGIGLLGEAARVDTPTVACEVVSAFVACAGVFALAKYRLDARVPTALADRSDLAGPSSTDRPNGSST